MTIRERAKDQLAPVCIAFVAGLFSVKFFSPEAVMTARIESLERSVVLHSETLTSNVALQMQSLTKTVGLQISAMESRLDAQDDRIERVENGLRLVSATHLQGMREIREGLDHLTAMLESNDG